jgi:hypothetical protein
MSRILRWERTKDPDESVDYTFNWVNQLSTDIITGSSYTYTADPDNTPLVIYNTTFTDTVATLWTSGGTEGTDYYITNRITTLGGRTLEQTGLLKVGSR